MGRLSPMVLLERCLQRAMTLANDVTISVADREQYWSNTNRIYVEEIP